MVTQPDPFSALLDAIAETKEVASKLHADLLRGDKAHLLLEDLVVASEAGPGFYDEDEWFRAIGAARAFLAASPAIPPGDGDA